MSEKKLQKLTEKQELFIRHYLTNGQNGNQAAIAAGYNKKNARIRASQLLTCDNVKKRLQEIQERKGESLKFTYENKLKMLAEMAKKCMTGDNMPNGNSHPSGLTSCISEMNRMQGDYAPTKTLNANLNADAKDFDQLDQMLSLYEKDF